MKRNLWKKKTKSPWKDKESNNQDKCKYCGFLYGEEGDPLNDEEWLQCDNCRAMAA